MVSFGYDVDFRCMCSEESVRRAKEYISGALAAMLDLGCGSGPMDHAFDIRPEYRIEAR